jgi:hypothetical protein
MAVSKSHRSGHRACSLRGPLLQAMAPAFLRKAIMEMEIGRRPTGNSGHLSGTASTIRIRNREDMGRRLVTGPVRAGSGLPACSRNPSSLKAFKGKDRALSIRYHTVTDPTKP